MNKNIKNIAVCGMFAAMIFVLTMFVKIPVASGYVHFGDALVYIGAMLLGAPYAIIAAVIGEGLADIAGGYAVYFPATAIIKILVTIPFIMIKDKSKIINSHSRFMTLPAGCITILGYFIADMIIDKTYAVIDVPGNAIQAGASAVIFLLIGLALDKVNIKSKINLR